MNDKIKCPNCGHNFDVEDALGEQMKEQMRAEFEAKANEQAKMVNEQKDALKKKEAEFELKKERENEMFKKRLAKELEQESVKIEKENTEKFEMQLKALALDNEKRKEENRLLKTQEIALLQKEKELKEKQEDLELNLQKQMLEKQGEIEERARIKEREANDLKMKEVLKQLEDQKKLTEEMKRKQEQGSMQLQGEVQELALEELLSSNYPWDNISEVGKGVKGADCVQTVYNMNQMDCGSIVYESKRTKTFGSDWIDKLKQDQVSCNAEFAVLVTETMPKDMERFGEKDGVWICSFSEIKSLSFVLREMLIKMQTLKGNQENKGEKMELLYRYLTGTEFSQNINRIVENYSAMLNQLNVEKNRTYKSWKEREKQIGAVQENLSYLFGSIKGIAGSDVLPNTKLELGDGEEEDA